MYVYIYLCTLQYADPFTPNSDYLLLLFLLHAYIHINSKKEPTVSDYEINNSYII